MIKRNHILIILSFITIAILLNVGIIMGKNSITPKDNPIQIKNCADLNIPGKTYELTRDISTYKSYCINISANNITLDCQNHKIKGNANAGIKPVPGGVAKYGIWVWRNDTIPHYYLNIIPANVTIRNCQVTGWDTAGIYLERANVTTLENLNVYGNADDGIQFWWSQNTLLKNITANHNGGNGIYLAATFSNNLTDITANSNNYGINLYAAHYSKLKGITANSNNYDGLHIVAGGDIYPCSFNDITANSNNIGLNIASLRCTYSNIIANSNNAMGIYVYGNINTFTNLTVNSNNGGGIYFNYIVNSIKNSRIENNNGYGLYLNSAAPGADHLIYNNFFNNTKNVELSGFIVTNKWNTTRQAGQRIYSVGTEIGGNFWANASGQGYSQYCTDADFDGFCDVPYNLNPKSSHTPADPINIDYLPLSDEFL